MEIDDDNTLKIEYYNDKYINDLMHNFTDYHINTFDNKLYYGDPTEKFIDHKGTGKYWLNKINKLRCNYCYEKFKSHNDLIRHLGYNNVDIRNRENNLLITHFYQPVKLKNPFLFSPEIKFLDEIAKDGDSSTSSDNMDDEGFLGDIDENISSDNSNNSIYNNSNNNKNSNIKYTKDLDESFLNHFNNISVSNNYFNKNKYLCQKCIKSENSRLIKKKRLKNKKKELNLSIDNLTKYLENSKI